ncbi:PilW family protein [Porticoccus sp.]|uniref:PilW family protein n=1 Tax=Porticoccus sp. TaxID=2024853 RepID=UPI003F697775
MKFSRIDRQRGFSLIELMVSILLGLFLTAGVISVYIDSKSNYQSEDELARIQENGRYALELLKRELALVGFFGGNLNTGGIAPGTVTADCSANWTLNTDEPLDFINDFASSLTTVNGITLGCLSSADIVPGTDLVTIKRTAGDFTLKNGVYNDGLTKADDSQWYLRMAGFGDVMEWTYIDSSGGFDSADVGLGSEVAYWEYNTNIFYIRNYSVDTDDGVPTLCAERLVGDSISNQCLIEGIEDMQIEFGVDTDGDGVPNQFKAAPTGAELGTAVVARIYLLVRSIDPVAGYTNEKTYSLGEKAVAAKNDRYLRRVFTTTIQMRNTTLPAT